MNVCCPYLILQVKFGRQGKMAALCAFSNREHAPANLLHWQKTGFNGVKIFIPELPTSPSTRVKNVG